MRDKVISLGSGALVTLCLAAGSHILTSASFAEDNDPEVRKVIEEYCVAISDDAAERRMALQTIAMKELETKVDEKITRLENKKQELEVLLKRLEEARNLAGRELVEIYSGIEPEAASLQLEKLDARLASSVLRQLSPRQASAILNEMTPDYAARMAGLIASAAQREKADP